MKGAQGPGPAVAVPGPTGTRPAGAHRRRPWRRMAHAETGSPGSKAPPSAGLPAGEPTAKCQGALGEARPGWGPPCGTGLSASQPEVRERATLQGKAEGGGRASRGGRQGRQRRDEERGLRVAVGRRGRSVTGLGARQGRGLGRRPGRGCSGAWRGSGGGGRGGKGLPRSGQAKAWDSAGGVLGCSHLARLLVHVEGADDALGDLAAGALDQVLSQPVGQVGLARATGAREHETPVLEQEADVVLHHGLGDERLEHQAVDALLLET